EDTAIGGLVTPRASVEKSAASGDELVAARAGPDELDGRSDELTDPFNVVAASLRQVVPAASGADVLLPAGHLLVDRLAVFVVRDVGEGVVEALASEVVAGADLQQGLVVEDVETHEGGAADPVQPNGVAGHGGVEPSDAARSPGNGAEFVASLADLVADVVEELRWERSVAHAGGICLEDSDGEVDLGRWYAAPSQRPAGGWV